MSFSDDFTFTRGTGATRINPAGLIVGVDFSSTSITFGTGSKAFTLTADLAVNRDWSIGESVIAVSQAAPLGSMEGTVTAYDPATQVLTIDVTISTGTGTSTNWRIGSLEVRRDADGVLREPLRTNLLLGSQDLTSVSFSVFGATKTTGQSGGIFGSADAVRISDDSSLGAHYVQRNANRPNLSAGTVYVATWIFSEINSPAFIIGVSTGTNISCRAAFNTQTLALISTGQDQISVIEAQAKFEGGKYFASITFVPSINSDFSHTFSFSNTLAVPEYNGNVTDAGLFSYQGASQYSAKVLALDVQAGASPSSYIPTTTVAVTRNADTFTFTPAAIAKFRQGQGALIVEANASDAGTAQRAALRLTGPAGEIRFGKQGVATSGNFTKMAEGGDVQLLGNATQGVTNNGLEYGLFNPTRSDTGVGLGAVALSGVAYNGSNEFGFLFSNAEATANSTLGAVDVKSFGGGSLNGAHWNGSRFIVVTGGAGNVMISTDGLSYRRVNTPVITQPCNEVTSGMVGPTLRNVIVGNAGFIATSDDNGETWTSRTSGSANTLLCVAHNGTDLFGAGIAVNNGTVNIAKSSDGITWTITGTGDVVGNRANQDIHFGNGVWVIVGNDGRIITSPDLTTFTESPSSRVVTTQSLLGVHYNASANLWVAVGNAGTIITATDPTGTWTLQTSGTTQNLNEVNYFNNLWVAGGTASTLLTSPNATTWTPRGTTSGTINGIAASPTRSITTGTLGGFASSEDGLTYTSRTNNNAVLNGIAYGAGVYVSVGNAVNGSGYIATIDGAGTVTRRVSGVTGAISSVNYLNGIFVATVQTVNAGRVLTSPDGITWTIRDATGTTGNQGIFDTAFGNGIYLNVYNLGYTARSTDGIAFVAQLSLAGTARGVAFANGVFVTVGDLGRIYTTTDGLTFTLRTSGTTQNLTSVMYSTRDQRWYAAGNAGTLIYSEDNGVTWASVNNAGFGAVSDTTLQANKLLPQWKSGRNTMALSYKANEVIVGLNGVAVTDTANTIPSITAGVLGESFNGKIKSAKFQPNPLTAAEVVAITGVTK